MHKSFFLINYNKFNLFLVFSNCSFNDVNFFKIFVKTNNVNFIVLRCERVFIINAESSVYISELKNLTLLGFDSISNLVDFHIFISNNTSFFKNNVNFNYLLNKKSFFFEMSSNFSFFDVGLIICNYFMDYKSLESLNVSDIGDLISIRDNYLFSYF
jgi:hypothetical protein